MDQDLSDQTKAIQSARNALRPQIVQQNDSTLAPPPDKQQAREALGYEPTVPEGIEDIDPEQWLTHDDTEVYDYVLTRAGRLKISALLESELREIRKAAEKWRVPGKPSAGRELDPDKLRAAIVAASLNKAYGWTGTDKELTAKKIQSHDKLSGEISVISFKIQRISGFDAEELREVTLFS